MARLAPTKPTAESDPVRLAAWRSLDTLVRSMDRVLRQALDKERDLPLPWFRLLDALRVAGGPVGVGDLAAALRLPMSSVSQQLDQLEGDGLVRRLHGVGADHRQVLVTLTPEGRRSWQGGETTVRVALRRHVFAGVDVDDVAFVAEWCSGLLDP
jgi:DNA-binding MarR family transcriptional regulator